MTLRQILEETPELTLGTLQRLQREYDRTFIADDFAGFNKVRHTYAHLGKLLGRLAEYVQSIEDGDVAFSANTLKEKVVPDLLVYSVWLAEELGVNIEEAYLRRFVSNIRRLHQNKITAEELEELERVVSERLEE